ncbi:hypothetical protein OPT61_g3991 [Boeremia exigua]|uniref:Uncharacterized protein n=1 Tax=Boeremia exigua TaxID=749465 RepID=A0ACC2IFT7_9PLEO|nr:hypothetical protein OPT61_g3991 [Boeremia exigua]
MWTGAWRHITARRSRVGIDCGAEKALEHGDAWRSTSAPKAAVLHSSIEEAGIMDSSSNVVTISLFTFSSHPDFLFRHISGTQLPRSRLPARRSQPSSGHAGGFGPPLYIKQGYNACANRKIRGPHRGARRAAPGR